MAHNASPRYYAQVDLNHHQTTQHYYSNFGPTYQASTINPYAAFAAVPGYAPPAYMGEAAPPEAMAEAPNLPPTTTSPKESYKAPQTKSMHMDSTLQKLLRGPGLGGPFNQVNVNRLRQQLLQAYLNHAVSLVRTWCKKYPKQRISLAMTDHVLYRDRYVEFLRGRRVKKWVMDQVVIQAGEDVDTVSLSMDPSAEDFCGWLLRQEGADEFPDDLLDNV